MRGPVFLSFEGLDGSGKTTQIERLAASLTALGRHVEVFREPGGTELGERIRELVLIGGDVSPWAEVSLFAAARAQLVQDKIRPSLEAGRDVICDRYLDSSVAYQGAARGLGEEAVFDWNQRVTGGLLPDATFLLALPAEEAGARIARSPAADPVRATPTPDRLERESLAFRARVERAYAELARRSARVVSLDATLAPEAIASQVFAHVQALLATAQQSGDASRLGTHE